MNAYYKRALLIFLVTNAADTLLGLAYAWVSRVSAWRGLYCAVATATTVGCDIRPTTAAAYVLSAVMMLTVVPLFATVFSFITTGLTAQHIDKQQAKPEAPCAHQVPGEPPSLPGSQ